MASSIDVDAWKHALADRETVEAARERFTQQRFTMGERERKAAADSVRFQAEQVEQRIAPLRELARQRQRILESRLANLAEQRNRLEARAASGQGSAARINRENRALQARISLCAHHVNALAKLLDAQRPEDLDALDDDELACLAAPVDAPAWSGAPATALPMVMSATGFLAASASALPWFGAEWGALWSGISGDATPLAGRILGYVAIALPLALAGIALTPLRNRRWLTIAVALGVVFAWTGLCYLQLLSSSPVWTVGDLFGRMRVGAWLYAAAAFAGLVAACYYAQGEGNTAQRSLRAAARMVALFAIPGLTVAGLLAFRPSPPAITVEVSTVADEFDLLSLTFANNSSEPVDLSLPWSNETHYGVKVEMQLAEGDDFRSVEETGECWRVPTDRERTLNRATIAPGTAERVWFDVACIRAMGYAPQRLRFTLTNADGETIKAFQAIIPT